MKRRTVLRLFPWVVLAITLLALAVRLPHLTARSLWFDEAFSWRLIQFAPLEFLTRAAADVHPILYYLLLWIWMLPARIATVLDPEAVLLWMRLFSVVLGVGTVAAMTFVGMTLFRSRWTAAAAGLLTAVNAFQVQYAWEARMYTLGTVLLPLAMVALFRTAFARTSRVAWQSGIGFGMSLGAFLHVHYYALFSWFALGLAKLLHFLSRMRRRGVRAVLRAPSFQAAEVGFWLSALLFLPWLPVFLAQVSRVQAAFWIPPFQAASIPNTLTRLFWGGVANFSPLALVLASLATAAVVLVPLLRGRSFGDLIAAASFAVPLVASLLVSLRTSVYLDRYFLFASLGLILLAARTLSFLPRRVRTWSLLLVGVLGLVSLAQFWSALDFPAHPGARAAAASLAAQATPGDAVIVSSPFVYFPMAFHLGCRMSDGRCQNNLAVRLFSETGELVHFAGGPILVPRDLVGPEVFQSGTPRLWVVDTTGFGGSRLAVPAPYLLAREERFAELFSYQGDIIVREYQGTPRP